MIGYASYLIPAALVVLGWHYFWCRPLDAIYTKLVGTALLFASLSGLLALAIGNHRRSTDTPSAPAGRSAS